MRECEQVTVCVIAWLSAWLWVTNRDTQCVSESQWVREIECVAGCEFVIAWPCVTMGDAKYEGLISLWLCKENKKLRDWKNIFTLHIPPWAPHTYGFVVPTSLTHPRKILLVVLQIGNRKSQRLISTPTYMCEYMWLRDWGREWCVCVCVWVSDWVWAMRECVNMWVWKWLSRAAIAWLSDSAWLADWVSVWVRQRMSEQVI
jgi:hypothetical protein